jgi:hypothetical protein
MSPNFRISFASPKSLVAGSPAAAERDGAGVSGLARQRLGPHDRGIGAEALRRLAGGDAIVEKNER